MYAAQALFLLLRHLSVLALVGTGFVFFAGPIFSLLGIFSGLALVGFILWMPLHSLIHGPDRSWRRVWDEVRTFVRSLVHQNQPLRNRAEDALTRTAYKVRTFCQRLAVFFVEVMSGAVLGGLAMVLRVEEVRPGPLALGILAGAACGVLVALYRLRSTSAATPDVNY